MNELSKAKAEIDALVERISDPSPRGVVSGQPGGGHARPQPHEESHLLTHSTPGTDHITIGWDIATCRAVFDYIVWPAKTDWSPPNKLIGQAVADLALRIAAYEWAEKNCDHDVCHDEHGHSDGCVYEGRGGD